jgi:hypothetical protein
MAYPQQFQIEYTNPSGNLSASGYFQSYITQQMANGYPVWDAIRQDSNSVGQQFLSPFARIADEARDKLKETLSEKFIDLAPVDEIDVLTRMKISSNISFLENQYIECWTAPSGATPSGYPFPEPAGADPDTFNSVQLEEVSDLENFYYHVLPTRLKAYNTEQYSDERSGSIGVSFPVRASGIFDTTGKYVDVWKRQHDLAWAHADELSYEFLKQDSITHETFDSVTAGASGYPKGFCFYRGKICWIGYVQSPSGYFLNVSNPRPAPSSESLDSLAVFDISDLVPSGIPPSGIDIDEEGHIWILDEDRKDLYSLDFMYDYFLVDKETRYIYFREDYSDPGVFVKPA